MFYNQPKLTSDRVQIKKQNPNLGEFTDITIPPRHEVTSDPQAQLNVITLVNNLLNIINIDSYLVGGAVRDWHLNKPMNDFDVYCILKDWNFANMSFTTLENLIENILSEELGFTRYFSKAQTGYHHLVVKTIKGNVNIYIMNFYNFYGYKLQLMVTAQNVTIEELISHFDCSICEYYYDFDNPDTIFTSTLNLHYLEKKSVLVSYDCRNSEHIKKMKARFPEYTFLSFPYTNDDRLSKFVPLDLTLNTGG